MFKFSFFSLFLFSIYTNLIAQEQLEKSTAFKGSAVAYLVKDVDQNKIIYAHNQKMRLAPASTQKIITTSMALDILGESYPFYSLIGHQNPIEKGVLKGNLIFKPNANPAFCNERWNYDLNDFKAQIIAYLKANNIEKIEGDFVIADSLYQSETLPRKWLWEDIGNYFGANPSGLSINENKLTLHFQSGKIGEPTQIKHTVPNTNLIIHNHVIAHQSNADLAYAFSKPMDNFITVRGGIPANKSDFKVVAALPHPHEFLSNYLKKELEIYGITKVLTEKNLNTPLLNSSKIHEINLKQLVKEVNQNSVNLLAELCKNHCEKAVGDLESYFKQNYSDEISISLYDGSGLSRFNAVNTEHLLAVLEKEKDNLAFTQSLAVAGQSGTLKSWFTHHEVAGKIIAKSGYTEGVRAYAGYVSSKTNKHYAFAIIVNNYESQNKYQVKKAIQNFLLQLYLNG